jgi:hypothetical protein
MVFCFVQNFFFGQHKSSFCPEFFFPEYNIRVYDKNSESDYFFLPPPNSEYFFQQHWESEYFFLEISIRKNITPSKYRFKELILLIF